MPVVKRYVENQMEHHKQVQFQDEMIAIYKKAGIDYNPEYMMKGYADEWNAVIHVPYSAISPCSRAVRYADMAGERWDF